MTPTTVLAVVLALCAVALVVGVWWPPGDSLEEHVEQALALTRPALGPDDDPDAMAAISDYAKEIEQ